MKNALLKVTNFGTRNVCIPIMALAFLLGGFSAAAREGFNTSDAGLPRQVSKAWNATFLLGLKELNGAFGAAFLVKRTKLPGTDLDELLFLTSDHNVAGNCGNEMQCSNFFLTASKVFDMNQNAYLTVDDRKLNFYNFKIVRRSRNPDLALIRATILTGIRPEIQPLRIANCGRLQKKMPVYNICYPYLNPRAQSHRPPASPNLIMRRWSTGLIVDQFFNSEEFPGELVYFTGTTADSIGGCSGGPVVLDTGEVVGVNDSYSHKADPLTVPYVGRDTDPMEFHNLFTRCEYLEAFINNRYVSLDPNDYYKDREEQVAAAR